MERVNQTLTQRLHRDSKGPSLILPGSFHGIGIREIHQLFVTTAYRVLQVKFIETHASVISHGLNNSVIRKLGRIGAARKEDLFTDWKESEIRVPDMNVVMERSSVILVPDKRFPIHKVMPRPVLKFVNPSGRIMVHHRTIGKTGFRNRQNSGGTRKRLQSAQLFVLDSLLKE